MKRFPEWVKPHLFDGRRFQELSLDEVHALRDKLSRFRAPDPLVSIVIPAYNEEENIYRTLSSLAATRTRFPAEIIVVNNNSTDRTVSILKELGVKWVDQPLQGIAFARQMGLDVALGKYHLCADADTLYPPEWVEEMVKPMEIDKSVVGVYGRYSILLPPGHSVLLMRVYEFFTGILFRIRRRRREFVNVLGFNMGFITERGRSVRGFDVAEVRKFDNSEDSEDYTIVSEDGNMALKLSETGRLKFLTSPKVRVYTSARKVLKYGSISAMLFKKIRQHLIEVIKYDKPVIRRASS